ncbi:hypothetical protein [Candidatus Coxiella mudrowiae]|uniref:hypothetical protein n=1 Tax=Candidatus Coxiella mudrowiae TaxID=2054173 RepID=UPI0015620373|nr:hypothetical protein [Candidatus Coxiella mudrowiae]
MRRTLEIMVHYELLSITPNLVINYTEDHQFRLNFQERFNSLLKSKDLLLEEIQREAAVSSSPIYSRKNTYLSKHRISNFN